MVGALALFIVAVLSLLMLPDSTPVRPKFTISKQTTYLNGPLRDNGLIDYRAALDAEYARGVTPENNAVVLLWQVVGPDDSLSGFEAKYFGRLGTPPPAESGQYLFQPHKMVKEVVGGVPIYRPADRSSELPEPLDECAEAIERPWTRREFPKLAEWLDAKAALIQLAVAATNRPRYYSPLVAPEGGAQVMSVPLPIAQQSRQVARTLIARGMLALGEGRIDDAWQSALACHRLSRLVGQGPCLVDMLVSLTIEGMAENLDVVIIGSKSLTIAQCTRFAADLRRLPAAPDFTTKVDLFERCSNLDAILSLADEGARSLTAENAKGGVHRLLARFHATNGADWDIALRLANQFFDEFLAAASKPSFADRQRAEKAWDAHFHQVNQQNENGETDDNRSQRAVKKVALMLIPELPTASDARDRIEQRFELLQLALALAAYRGDRGAYPAKLADIAGDYIARIPVDRFNDQPLHYREKDGGVLLYSVGPSLRDEDGREPSSDPRGDNVTIHIGPPRP